MTFERRTFLASSAVATIGFTSLSSISSAFAQEIDKEKLMEAGPLGEMSIGPDDAKVTIIEYASATCPHCARFHDGVFKELKEKYVNTGKVRFVFREFPFDDLALAAFMLARCAPKEKYFPMIDILFKQQSKWTARDANARDELLRIAKQAAFTDEDFDACLKNEEIAKGILAVRKTGQDLGVDSTPYFFVNGEKLQGNQTLPKFEELITKHLG